MSLECQCISAHCRDDCIVIMVPVFWEGVGIQSDVSLVPVAPTVCASAGEVGLPSCVRSVRREGGWVGGSGGTRCRASGARLLREGVGRGGRQLAVWPLPSQRSHRCTAALVCSLRWKPLLRGDSPPRRSPGGNVCSLHRLPSLTRTTALETSLFGDLPKVCTYVGLFGGL